MKRFWLCLILCVVFAGCNVLPMTASGSPVPDTLPEDFGGKTRYGYMMDLKNTYMPATVFSDAVKYSNSDRENARRAVELLISAATQAMETANAPDQYNLYLRAYSYDLKYQDTKDDTFKQLALADYQKTVENGGAYAQADFDRLSALELAAAPLHWQISQILPLGEAAELMGTTSGNIYYAKSAYAKEDGRLGLGYALRTVEHPDQSAVFVQVDLQGGKARYEVLKRFAFLGKAREIAGLGEEAVLFGSRSVQGNGLLYATVLVLKAPLVLQVSVPDYVWRGPGFNMNPEDLALHLAERFLNNLFDNARSVPPGEDASAEDIMPQHLLPKGAPDSPVPGELPSDLGGKTSYGYIMDLKNAYLKKDIFTGAGYSQTEKDNARQAARLIVDLISAGFDQNGPNAFEAEIRGSCYALAYADTGNPFFRLMALNDLKTALSQGNTLAKKQFDELASPMLLPFVELSQGAKGGHVAYIQKWLSQMDVYPGEANGIFDEVTSKAVIAFESSHGLTEDGIADIAFLLSLYAKVDDGDALFYAK